jgi:hypothetical protein
MLSEFEREDGSKIFRVAFWANDAVGQAQVKLTQVKWKAAAELCDPCFVSVAEFDVRLAVELDHEKLQRAARLPRLRLANQNAEHER